MTRRKRKTVTPEKPVDTGRLAPSITQVRQPVWIKESTLIDEIRAWLSEHTEPPVMAAYKLGGLKAIEHEPLITRSAVMLMEEPRVVLKRLLRVVNLGAVAEKRRDPTHGFWEYLVGDVQAVIGELALAISKSSIASLVK